MPIAIVVGCAPVVVFTGPQKLPIDCDEMGVAGGLAGAPIRVVKAATIDLEVPADAEFVFEGLIDPELLEPEGPFGESHGEKPDSRKQIKCELPATFANDRLYQSVDQEPVHLEEGKMPDAIGRPAHRIRNKSRSRQLKFVCPAILNQDRLHIRHGGTNCVCDRFSGIHQPFGGETQ